MEVTVDNTVTKRSTIRGVPLSAFTCWQHGSIDVVTLSRVATFMRRGAIQHGFIDADFFKFRPDLALPADPATIQAAIDAGSPKLPKVKKTRFFVISCDIVMDKECPKEPTAMKDVANGELIVSALSNSTFGLYLDMRRCSGAAECAAAGEAAWAPMGYVHMTYCCIDEATRRSTALEPYRRALIENVMSPDAIAKFNVQKMQRLERPNAELAPVFFQHPMPVRDADTDFNGHLNQSMYIAFVVDAVKAFMRAREKELGIPVRPGDGGGEDDDADQPNSFTAVAPVHDATSSKVVRRFRIDYLREVPSREAQLNITLQRVPKKLDSISNSSNGTDTVDEVDPRSPQVVAHTLRGDEHVHSLWFEVHATIPGATASFCAAQGTVEVNSKWL